MVSRLLIRISRAIICALIAFVSLKTLATVTPIAFLQKKDPAKWYRPGSTLDLDFINDRYYLNGTANASFPAFVTAAGATYSRASTGSYFDSTGTMQTAAANTRRMNYDAKSLQNRGLLIEEGSTNYYLNSSDFTQASWVWGGGGTKSITTFADTAPDGTVTAEKITRTSGTSYLSQAGLPAPASTTVTVSAFVKADSSSLASIAFSDTATCGSQCVATFNLGTKTATWDATRTAQNFAWITELKNGWFRISASLNFSAVGAGVQIYPAMYGSGSGSIFLWGAQYETQSFVSSYMATAGAAASRSADIFYIPTAAWFNATTGTFLGSSYGQYNSVQTSVSRMVAGDNPKAYIGFNQPNSYDSATWNGTTYLGTPNGTVVYPNLAQPRKGAFAWDQVAGTGTVAVSGGVYASGSFSGNWTSTNIYPGSSNVDCANAEVGRVTFFPQRMPDGYLRDMSQ